MSETLKESFGRRLRSFREKAELSADSLASILGVHRNTIYQLERGEQWISAELLEKIALKLDIGPDRLFTDFQPKPTPSEALEVLREVIRNRRRVEDALAERIQGLSPDHRAMIESFVEGAEQGRPARESVVAAEPRQKKAKLP